MTYERTEAFYKNVLRDFFGLKESDEFINDSISEDIKGGIEYALEKSGFTEEETNAITLKYEKNLPVKEIAAMTELISTEISSLLARFRHHMRYSTLKMYFMRGIEEGKRHEEAVKELIEKQENRGYDDFSGDIKRLDSVWLGFMDVKASTVERLYKADIKTFGQLLAVMNDRKSWKTLSAAFSKKEKQLIERNMYSLGLYERNGAEDAVTSFIFTWIDCGLCCGEFPVKEKVVLSRFDRLLYVKHYNGSDKLLYETKAAVSEDLAEDFFEELEKIKWEEDYSIPVCDGWAWEMVLGKGKGKDFKAVGTVEAPPEAEKLTAMINKMLCESYCPEAPHLWGLADEV